MSNEQQSLNDLRHQIDEIDTAIHDLLMRRSDVAQRIGAVKGENSVYIRWHSAFK